MKKIVAVAACVVLLAGCNQAVKPTPENYLNTINAWLPDHRQNDCLLTVRFPYETSDAAETKRMDTLVAVKVLASTHEPAIHVTRYTQTDFGKKYGDRLCYGYRKATEIVSSTPPAPANGFTETNVVYRYELRDLPSWADVPEVMAAYPAMAKEASGKATDTITLALTRVGWSVPD